jgi:hypothetical protein
MAREPSSFDFRTHDDTIETDGRRNGKPLKPPTAIEAADERGGFGS